MTVPAYIRIQGDQVLMAIRVQPRASRNEIGPELGNELKIKVTAPPVDSAANEALREFLAEVLQCSRSNVQIVRGHTSRHKTVAITGVKPETIRQCLTS
jgi:hypothetical protein